MTDMQDEAVTASKSRGETPALGAGSAEFNPRARHLVVQSDLANDWKSKGEWLYTVREAKTDGRAYNCSVSVRLAFEQSEPQWWASRGNAAMARYSADDWARAQARKMANAAFDELDNERESQKPSTSSDVTRA